MDNCNISDLSNDIKKEVDEYIKCNDKLKKLKLKRNEETCFNKFINEKNNFNLFAKDITYMNGNTFYIKRIADLLVGFYAKETIEFDLIIQSSGKFIFKYKLEKDNFMYTYNNKTFIPLIAFFYDFANIQIYSNNLKNLVIIYGFTTLRKPLSRHCYFYDEEKNNYLYFTSGQVGLLNKKIKNEDKNGFVILPELK